MSTVRRRVAIVVVTLVAVTAASIVGWFAIRPGPDLVQGEVEATEVKVASKLPARVLEIAVREGDQVRTGELLVRLSSPEIVAKLDQAEENKEQYLEIVEQIHANKIDGNFSLKPTMFGLLIDKDACYKIIREIVKKAGG